jgi:hypothetical protein
LESVLRRQTAPILMVAAKNAGLTMVCGPKQPRNQPAAEGRQLESVGRKVGVQK